MEATIYDVSKIMKRYDVGLNSAYKIMRNIETVNGGLTIGKGRILQSEIDYYERTRGGRDSNE